MTPEQFWLLFDESAGGGGGFTPSQLSGLVLWYDPSDSATLTVSGVGDVGAIVGHGGYGPTLTHTGYPGAIRLGSQNGLDTLTFGPAGTGLTGVLTTTWTTSRLSAFAVFNFDDSVDFARGLSLSSSDEPNDWETANSMMVMTKEGSPPTFPGFGYAGASASIPATIAGSWHVFSAVTTATGITLAIDGTTAATASKGDTAMSSERFGIGGRAIGTEAGDSYRGQLGEVLVYSRPLTVDERAQVVDYLMARWGL